MPSPPPCVKMVTRGLLVPVSLSSCCTCTEYMESRKLFTFRFSQDLLTLRSLTDEASYGEEGKHYKICRREYMRKFPPFFVELNIYLQRNNFLFIIKVLAVSRNGTAILGISFAVLFEE